MVKMVYNAVNATFLLASEHIVLKSQRRENAHPNVVLNASI